jgi:hypothetical protein
MDTDDSIAPDQDSGADHRDRAIDHRECDASFDHEIRPASGQTVT